MPIAYISIRFNIFYSYERNDFTYSSVAYY